jgi:hypothetical protein
MRICIKTDECCDDDSVIITQAQGDSSPIILCLPYDISGATFTGTIEFPAPVDLSIGSGITVLDIELFTGSIASNILTVSAITSGTIYIGMPVNGLGVRANTIITGFVTGTGGVGTYTLNQGQAVSSTTMATSRISLQLTSSQTQDVPVGQYDFDLWQSLGSVNQPILSGTFVINPSLTVIS